MAPRKMPNMASVQRHKSRYRVKWHVDGRAVYESFTTKREADDFARKVGRAPCSTARPPPSSTPTRSPSRVGGHDGVSTCRWLGSPHPYGEQARDDCSGRATLKDFVASATSIPDRKHCRSNRDSQHATWRNGRHRPRDRPSGTVLAGSSPVVESSLTNICRYSWHDTPNRPRRRPVDLVRRAAVPPEPVAPMRTPHRPPRAAQGARDRRSRRRAGGRVCSPLCA